MVKHYRCCEERVCVGTEEEVISSTWDRKEWRESDSRLGGPVVKNPSSKAEDVVAHVPQLERSPLATMKDPTYCN